MDLEKLRACPEIFAPEYFRKSKQEFHYLAMGEQVIKFYLILYSNGYIIVQKLHTGITFPQ